MPSSLYKSPLSSDKCKGRNRLCFMTRVMLRRTTISAPNGHEPGECVERPLIKSVLIFWGSDSWLFSSNHRVIILLERACLHNRTLRNWCKFSRPECATTTWRHSRLRAHEGFPSGWGLRGNSPGIAASPISLLSMVALEESVGGAKRWGKFSSLESKHAPSI